MVDSTDDNLLAGVLQLRRKARLRASCATLFPPKKTTPITSTNTSTNTQAEAGMDETTEFEGKNKNSAISPPAAVQEALARYTSLRARGTVLQMLSEGLRACLSDQSEINDDGGGDEHDALLVRLAGWERLLGRARGLALPWRGAVPSLTEGLCPLPNLLAAMAKSHKAFLEQLTPAIARYLTAACRTKEQGGGGSTSPLDAESMGRALRLLELACIYDAYTIYLRKTLFGRCRPLGPLTTPEFALAQVCA